LIKWYVKDYRNITDPRVRESYGVLSGVLGIICNLFLFIVKISIGLLINSIAVISDAFNNLSDLGSSLISILGVKLSNRPADREHPHGHGRYEYITSLTVSFIIFGVGLELLIN
jgi:cation diffusion facilitator family transporter